MFYSFNLIQFKKMKSNIKNIFFSSFIWLWQSQKEGSYFSVCVFVCSNTEPKLLKRFLDTYFIVNLTNNSTLCKGTCFFLIKLITFWICVSLYMSHMLILRLASILATYSNSQYCSQSQLELTHILSSMSTIYFL